MTLLVEIPGLCSDDHEWEKKEKLGQFNLSAIDYCVRGFLWNGASWEKRNS